MVLNNNKISKDVSINVINQLTIFLIKYSKLDIFSEQLIDYYLS